MAGAFEGQALDPIEAASGGGCDPTFKVLKKRALEGGFRLARTTIEGPDGLFPHPPLRRQPSFFMQESSNIFMIYHLIRAFD